MVPSPHDSALALVKAYQADMPTGDFSHVSLEGYVSAAVFVQALKNAAEPLTRDSFIDALEHLDTDLGGFKVSFSRNDHQGSSAVFLTHIENGRARPVQRMR